MRVLIVDDNQVDLLAMKRALAGRYDLRSAGSLAEALAILGQGDWHPDVVVASLNLSDSQGLATLEALQEAIIGAPLIVSSGSVSETLRERLDALGADLHDKSHGFTLLRAVLQQYQLLYQAMAANRAEMLAHLDQVSQRAAESAVTRAVDQLMNRLGLDDGEGVRMAVRLARGWETAKQRFFSTLATGIASALLLALGAGIVAMIKHGESR